MFPTYQTSHTCHQTYNLNECLHDTVAQAELLGDNPSEVLPKFVLQTWSFVHCYCYLFILWLMFRLCLCLVCPAVVSYACERSSLEVLVLFLFFTLFRRTNCGVMRQFGQT